MFNINNNYNYNLYLCNIDKSIICALDYISIEYTQNFRQYDELSFEVPLYDNGWRQVENKYFNYLQPLYLILMEAKNGDELIFKEFFIVDSPNFSFDNGVIKKTIKCYSSDYEFNNRYLNSYEEVKVLYDVDNSYGGGILNDMLSQMENTWSVNYISSNLLGIYHSYDYSSSTYRSVIEDLENQFNCYFIFDTVNNYINIYDASINEYGEDTNIVISDENYLKSLSCDVKNSEMVTKLKVFGKDNITIAKYNPTGQLYILDYDWFQKNGRMSDSLSTAYTAWKTLVADNETTFQDYLNQLGLLQESLNTLNNELNDLNTQLEIIEDTLDALIDSNRKNTSEYDDAYAQKKSLKTQIDNKKAEIRDVEAQIETINNDITALNNSLSLSNNFTSEQLKELSKMTIESKLSMDSVTDEKQLYEYAKSYIKLKSKPTIDIDLNIVDILSIGDSYISKHYDKIKVGNYIYLDCASLGFNYDKYRIIKINHRQLDNSLTITISNKDRVNSEINYLNRIFAASAEAADTLETNESEYSAYSEDSDTIVYKSSTIDTSETTIKSNTNYINQRGFTGNSLGTRNGAIKIQGDQIVFSPDGDFETYYAILSSDGLYLETTDSTSRVVITPANGFQLDLWNSDISNWRNAIYLGITNGQPSLHIDNGYISLLKVDAGLEKNRILIDPSVGFEIDNNSSTTPGSPIWNKIFYIDTTGVMTLVGANFYTSLTGDRLVINSNGITAYNSYDEINGIQILNGNLSTIEFYYRDEWRGTLSQAGGSFSLYPGNNANLILGIDGKNVSCKGNWDLTGAIININNVTGSFATADGHYISVVNGYVTEIY